MKRRTLIACWSLFLIAGCPDDTRIDDDAGPGDAASGGDRASADSSARVDGSAADAPDDAAGADAWTLACPADDAYEPNDDAAHAASLAHPGPYRNQMIACDADDWYAITAPASFGISVQLTFVASVNLDLELYRAADAVTPIDTSTGLSGSEAVYHERFEQETPLLVRVRNLDLPATAAYQLTITFHQNGLCDGDTASEPNDTPQTAAALTVPATLSGLEGCDAEDWYGFSVPADNGLSVELTHDPAQANLDLYLYQASDPTSPLASRTDYAPRKLVAHELFASETAVLVRVHNASYPGPRTGYTLAIALHPGGYCVDDNSEPNDSAAAATDISGQLLSGVLCRDNVDFYQFMLAEPGPGSRVVITADQRLDARLTAAGSATPLATAVESTTADGHRYTFTFDSAADSTYVVRLAKASGVVAVGVNYAFAAIKGTPPANDTCTQASAITTGTDVAGSTTNANDDVWFAAGSASCTGSDSDGPDVFYRLTVPASAGAQIRLTAQQPFVFYLIDDCTSRCCYAGAEVAGQYTILDYANTGASDQDLFLGVDGRGPATEGSFTLRVDLGAAGAVDGGHCVPNLAPDGGSGG
ncbi:MAG: hypothetical protein JXR83_14060 [Deltaproteobacteria bacterium]|nr:hypothetical protein [Deltaproteobacteria bacterium]